jgi:predicted SprT family Zn-dependent metalloprotease
MGFLIKKERKTMTREEKLESENSLIFLYQLISEFRKINNSIDRHLDKRLEMPRFVLKRGFSVLGMWSPKTRKLAISEELVRNYEWGAVVHVLKHEMAHMVVSEIFKLDDCRGHGEAFSKACKVVGCDNRRCCTKEFLAGFKGIGNESSVVTKIRKLMAKGQCEGATEAEAETFMKKAQSMMSIHNLTSVEVMGTEKVFVRRPVGGMHKRFPMWLFRLGDLVCSNYQVEQIRTYAYDRNGTFYRYLELFGEPHNIAVAEYVFHVVMSQGESLYEKHKKDPNRPKQWRKLTKASFMGGLIDGYCSTLSCSRADNVLAQTDEDTALILANDAILKERYSRQYPNVRQTSSSGPKGSGWGAGNKAGKGLNVRSGLNGSGGVRQIGG